MLSGFFGIILILPSPHSSTRTERHETEDNPASALHRGAPSAAKKTAVFQWKARVLQESRCTALYAAYHTAACVRPFMRFGGSPKRTRFARQKLNAL